MILFWNIPIIVYRANINRKSFVGPSKKMDLKVKLHPVKFAYKTNKTLFLIFMALPEVLQCIDVLLWSM